MKKVFVIQNVVTGNYFDHTRSDNNTKKWSNSIFHCTPYNEKRMAEMTLDYLKECPEDLEDTPAYLEIKEYISLNNNII